jgi:hypothetical protein
MDIIIVVQAIVQFHMLISPPSRTMPIIMPKPIGLTTPKPTPNPDPLTLDYTDALRLKPPV